MKKNIGLGIMLALAALGCSERSGERMVMDPVDPADSGPPPMLADAGQPPVTEQDSGLEPTEPDAGTPTTVDSGTPVVPVECTVVDLGSMVGENVAEGNTSGMENATGPTACGGGSGPDIAYQWVAPEAGKYTFDTQGTEWDTVLHVHQSGCDGAEMACNDDTGGLQSTVNLNLDVGAELFIVVDGYGTSSAGDFLLSITLNAADSEMGSCFDGIDNDRDGQTDCDDYDCDSEPSCTETMCGDGVDNDMDGEADCDDYDCYYDEACTETGAECTDGIDNDGDSLVDCADYNCSGEEACVEHNCGDGVDDEGDGRTDCDDYDCWDAPECTEDGDECTNGIDDDEDGYADCDDYDCDDFEACMELECDDGIDNNGDGYTDCDDYDCDENAHCSEIACDDGDDNDGDGQIDCLDYDCADDPVCMEECTDGIDNNDDGAIDCDDYDCYSSEFCEEAGMCTGGTDDDGDGRIDCDDSECRCDSACATDPCPGTDLGNATGSSLATGSNEGLCGFRRGTCAGNGAEVTYRWTAPSTGMFTFDTFGSDYDTVLYLLDGGACDGAELGCDDDEDLSFSLRSYVTVSLTEGQTVLVVVDGYSASSRGAYVLNINPGAAVAPTP